MWHKRRFYQLCTLWWRAIGQWVIFVLYKSLIADLKLDVLECRGQGYDGAGAVSGDINGLYAHFLQISDNAIYIFSTYPKQGRTF